MEQPYYYDADNSDDNQESVKHFFYVNQQVIRNIHHFYLSSMIEEPPYYVEMINRIQTAHPEDVIYMHLNTIGGYMSTGIQIINAMKASPAHVICSLEGEVASMGTLIFLSGDEFLVHENSSLMFHNYSGAVMGKGHEQIAALESATRWTDDFSRRVYVPFLTEEEVTDLIKGADIYMHPPEIIERLENMMRVRAAEQEPKPQKRATKKKVTKKKATARKTAKV